MDNETRSSESDKTNKSAEHSLGHSAQQNEMDPTLGMNPETLKKEFQELVEKKFGGKVQVLSMDDPSAFMGEDFVEGSDDETEENSQAIHQFQYKPKDIKEYLDRFVVGQDEAKKALAIAICDHYNHLKTTLSLKDQSERNYQKQNVLLLGPTGVGKTFLVRLISDLIGVPFVKADATRFSEVGYMGANVDDVIRDLVQVAGGDKALASKGIVYVDEVDKLASKKDQNGRDVSGRGVQFGFLRLLENSDVDLNSSHDIASQFKTFMNFQKKGKAEKEIVNTRDILFIFSGAFNGIDKIIEKRLGTQTIGIHQDKTISEWDQQLDQLEPSDLLEFGFEHEFVGRLPIRVSCRSLSASDLLKILTSSEHSIVKQYQQSFSHYGIQLKFEDDALKALAEQAYEQKTGARGLVAVFENLLRPYKFELPSTNVKQLIVTPELVKNPMGVLHHIMAENSY